MTVRLPIILFVVLTALLLHLASAASKPIRNLQVQLRGETYEIHDVTTVAELKERLQEETMMGTIEGSVTYRGRQLRPDDILRNVGVKEGAKLTLVLGESTTASTTTDTSKSTKTSTNSFPMRSHRLWSDTKESGGKCDFQTLLDFTSVINREELVGLIREGIEKMNTNLQSGWEETRKKIDLNGIDDPDKFGPYEEMRKSFLSDFESMEKVIAFSSSDRSMLEDPDKFRELMRTIVKLGMRASDEIIQAVMEVSLDFLRGAAIRKEEEAAAAAAKALEEEEADITNVLFELSESEDEF